MPVLREIAPGCAVLRQKLHIKCMHKMSNGLAQGPPKLCATLAAAVFFQAARYLDFGSAQTRRIAQSANAPVRRNCHYLLLPKGVGETADFAVLHHLGKTGETKSSTIPLVCKRAWNCSAVCDGLAFFR